MTTAAPAEAAASANPRPTPWDAPVTMTVLPLSMTDRPLYCFPENTAKRLFGKRAESGPLGRQGAPCSPTTNIRVLLASMNSAASSASNAPFTGSALSAPIAS